MHVYYSDDYSYFNLLINILQCSQWVKYRLYTTDASTDTDGSSGEAINHTSLNNQIRSTVIVVLYFYPAGCSSSYAINLSN